MKIEVLSIEGMEAACRGWQLSRNLTTEVTNDDVFCVDVPVCELPTCLLSLSEMTILEREIVASSRSHVMWARTSHVDDPSRFAVPVRLARPSNLLALKKMKAAIEAGLSQDEWRAYLPVTSMTAWTQRISYRDLVKLTGYFLRLSARPQLAPQLRDRLGETTRRLGEVVDMFTGSPSRTWQAVNTFQAVDFLHEGGVSVHEARTTGAFVSVGIEVPLWLRAQIVRHRPLSFVDTFFADVLARPDVVDLDIGTPVRMQLTAERGYWKSVLSKRSCWLAQDQLRGRKDPWAAIIERHGGAVLPCADGTCPYERDAALRLTDADPGVPCPRYMNLKDLDKTPWLEAMREAAESRASSWRDEIDSRVLRSRLEGA